MYSPSGQAVSKALCFLFREGDRNPRIVVKAMAEPRFGWRLRRESSTLESIRRRIGHAVHVADALPPPPLFAENTAGDFVLAEPYDPLGTATGAGSREHALGWLRAFHDASSDGAEPWGVAGERALLEDVEDAWRLAGLDVEGVVEPLRRLVMHLRGVSLPRCPVHGDFWRGNVAVRNDAVRIYDWEWAELTGNPLFDIWTYELGELRIRANEGLTSVDEPLAFALDRVRAELMVRRIDERFALAVLPAVIGTLAFRIRRRLNMYDGLETPSIALMGATQRLLQSRAGATKGAPKWR
jgi:hypothetical protein